MTDKGRIEDAVERAKGAAKEIAGKITGDARLEAEGRAEKAVGRVRQAAGGAKDASKGKG